MTEQQPACIYCGEHDEHVPLLQFQFHQEQYWICPQHFPILIHQPARLASQLPGIERLTPAEGHA